MYFHSLWNLTTLKCPNIKYVTTLNTIWLVFVSIWWFLKKRVNAVLLSSVRNWWGSYWSSVGFSPNIAQILFDLTCHQEPLRIPKVTANGQKKFKSNFLRSKHTANLWGEKSKSNAVRLDLEERSRGDGKSGKLTQCSFAFEAKLSSNAVIQNVASKATIWMEILFFF